MTDTLATAVARVLTAHREQYPLVPGGLAPCVTCKTPYPCVVAEALEPARIILAGGPVLRLHGARCADCGRPMVAQTADTVVCTCDDEPAPYRGQIDAASKLVDELTTLLYETAKLCQRCPVQHPAIVRCAACRRKADKPESVVHDSDCPVYRLRTALAIARSTPTDHPFTPDPVKPLCTDCDEPEAFHRG